MNTLSLWKNRITKTVLCAALALALAGQSTAAPYFKAFAQSSEAEKPEIDEDNYVGNEMLKDQFGEIVLYRWERMTSANMIRDDQWHPVLVFTGNNDSIVMNPAGTERFYLGEKHKVIEGAKWFDVAYENEYGATEKIGKPTSLQGVNESMGAMLWANYTANDPQLQPSNSVFYTTGDKNCMYFKFGGNDSHVNKPTYSFRLGDGKGNMSDYYLSLCTGDGFSRGLKHRDDGMLVITKNGRATGKSSDPECFNSTGNQFYIYNENAGSNDNYLVYKEKDKRAWILGCSDQADVMKRYHDKIGKKKFSVYVGEAMRFSAIKGSTTIRNGQILSVTESDYADTSNKQQHQNGVMLQNGQTLTIEKGGILSIEGDFINNGTIINNGGTIIVKKGGSIYPFLQGMAPNLNGCGTIKCLSGDIIIQEGGAIYAGLNDELGAVAPFFLDGSSTLINQGLLVTGGMRLDKGTVMECYPGSKTYTCYLGGNPVSQSKLKADGYGTVINDEVVMFYLYESKFFTMNKKYSDYNRLQQTVDDAILDRQVKQFFRDHQPTQQEYEQFKDMRLDTLYNMDDLQPYIDLIQQEEDKAYEVEENVPIYMLAEITDLNVKYPYTIDDYLEKNFIVGALFEPAGYDEDGDYTLILRGQDLTFKDVLSRDNSSFLAGNTDKVKALQFKTGAPGIYLKDGVTNSDFHIYMADGLTLNCPVRSTNYYETEKLGL